MIAYSSRSILVLLLTPLLCTLKSFHLYRTEVESFHLCSLRNGFKSIKSSHNVFDFKWWDYANDLFRISRTKIKTLCCGPSLLFCRSQDLKRFPLQIFIQRSHISLLKYLISSEMKMLQSIFLCILYFIELIYFHGFVIYHSYGNLQP